MNEAADEQRRQYLEYIKNFRLIDDDFMKLVFEDKECVQLLLRIVMEIPDLIVEEVKTEYTIHNVHGRGVRLDVFASDSDGKRYNIEIQREDTGAGRKRARFNSSMLDVNVLKSGKVHDELPETYVIFITEKDVLQKELPIYHIERVIMETGELFDDRSHIIYVNNEIKDDTPLGLLMRDFTQTNAGDIYYRELADRVRYFKETEMGVSSMCKAMEEMCKQAETKGREEGMREGRAEGVNAVIEAMKAAGMDTSQVEKLNIK